MAFRIVATGLLIKQPLFGALDADDKFLWVDQPFHAAEFATPSEASEFGRAWIGADGWKVQPK